MPGEWRFLSGTTGILGEDLPSCELAESYCPNLDKIF